MSSSIVKSVILSALLAVAFNASAADQQLATSAGRTSMKQNDASFGLNADPIWLALGGFGLKAEVFATRTLSIGLEGVLVPKYHVSKDSSSTVDGIEYNYEHSEITLGSNIMLTGTLSSNGLYIEPAVGYQQTRISDFDGLSGELNSPMGRFTVGYQWILAKHLRLAAGGGLEMLSSSDVVIKDGSGQEVLREKSSALGGAALDLQVGFVF